MVKNIFNVNSNINECFPNSRKFKNGFLTHSHFPTCHITYWGDWKLESGMDLLAVLHWSTAAVRCHSPLVKECDGAGPERCSLEHETICTTRWEGWVQADRTDSVIGHN